MKTLSITVPLDDKDAELLLTKFVTKELEGICIRESLHVLGALINEIKLTIPYIEQQAPEELYND